MNTSAIAEAVKQICDEKGISFEAVIETIEAALAAAYRKDFGEKNQNIEADFDLDTGGIKVYDVKTVVEDLTEEELAEIQAAAEQAEQTDRPRRRDEMPEPVAPAEGEEEKRRFNPKTDIQLKDAKELKKDAELGEVIRTPLELSGDFGRMAAQTAKQVITQKLRETERETLFNEFKGREGEIVVGTVQRREGRMVLVDLGRIAALLPPEEQIEGESYVSGAHLKLYIVSVNTTTKGPEVIVSRSHPEIVKKIFALEIPEIANEVVTIKGVAREAGARSKVAVYTDQENIDPIGSCIGQRGARIQTIISELKGEKIDIIRWSEDPVEYVGNALSPAKISKVEIDETNRTATVTVPEDQLSLAIGRAGQNVRLAARLTGWKIDVVSEGGAVATDEDGNPMTAEDGDAEEAEDQTDAESEADATENEADASAETTEEATDSADAEATKE